MNTDAQAIWPQNIHDENMMPPVSAAEDFSNYLDLDLDFSGFDDIQGNHASMDTNMEGYNMNMGDQQPQVMNNGANVNFTPQNQQQQQMQQGQGHPQMYQQANRYQQPRPIIPPTPSSGEIHGGVAAYYNANSGHLVYDQYHGKDDQMSFTPLVSPAVTPADANFHIPDYAIPGEYFSPLTSPAIEAQHGQHYRLYQGPRTSESGNTTSPAEMSLDHGDMSAPTTPAVTRQRRKQSQSGKARSVRQSPIVKAQSKRKQHNLSLKPSTVAEIAEAHQLDGKMNSRPGSGGVKASASESSGQDSVSPEALSEALMPPPALPTKSPGLFGQNRSPFLQGNEPATPATLMRLQKGPTSGSPMKPGQPRSQIEAHGDIMDDMMLPEPAASTMRPVVPPIDTGVAVLDEQSTPRLSAQGSKPRSAVVSASSTPIALTPMSKSPDGADIKQIKSNGRLSKKRQSVSSSQVSPAIRPKISPSIKPLMPNGAPTGISADHSALYLASKSNYQNIIDGTHLPGVTYPEALAENLSSKRTSHKIAEQGRRNRINTALKEIEGLLPPTPALLAQTKSEGSGNSEGETGETAEQKAANNQTTSKASTVEMAIIYIKALQAELKDTKSKLEVAERKLADGGSHSGGSQASE